MPVRVPAEQPDDDEAAVTRWVHQREAQMRTEAEQLARRWQGSIVALLGIAALAGTLGAPVADELSVVWRVLVGTLAASAMVAALVAHLAVSAAANGRPEFVERPASRTAITAMTMEDGRRRVLGVVRARRAATTAVVLLAVGLAALWVAPRSDSRTDQFQLVTADGPVMCGDLDTVIESLGALGPAQRSGGADSVFVQVVAVDDCEGR